MRTTIEVDGRTYRVEIERRDGYWEAIVPTQVITERINLDAAHFTDRYVYVPGFRVRGPLTTSEADVVAEIPRFIRENQHRERAGR